MKQRLERYEDWHARQMKVAAYRKEFDKLVKRGFLAYRIARVRERLGLTQKEFAKRMGVKQSALARIESGNEETVKLRTLERIAKAAHRELVIRFSEIPGWCRKCGGEVESRLGQWMGSLHGMNLGMEGVWIGCCATCGEQYHSEDLAGLQAEVARVVQAAARAAKDRVDLGEAGVIDVQKMQEVVL